MTDQPKVVDVNHASLEELSAVPGMGPALAEKVIAGRTYASLQELTRVRGIGSKSLIPLLAYLTLENNVAAPQEPPRELLVEAAAPIDNSAPPQAEAGEQSPVEYPVEEEYLLQEEGEGISPEGISPEGTTPAEKAPVEKAPAEANQAAVPEPVAQALPHAITQIPARNDGYAAPKSSAAVQPKNAALDAPLLAVGVGLLVLILGLVFSLGILRLINGTLSFASASQINTLQTRLDALGSQADILQQDVTGLRTRMDTLDALSGRVTSVEKQAQAVQDNLLATQAQVAALQEQYKQMNDQLTQLQAQSNVFQRFLDGMRSLLSNLFPAPSSQ
jgi:uncharacterized protein YoxC